MVGRGRIRRRWHRRHRLAGAALALLAAGCAVGPDFSRPETKAAAAWIDARDHRLHATEPQTAAWWQAFHDKTLDRLIALAYQNNLSLQATGAHVLQARALVGQAVGEFYPQQQQIQGAATEELQSATNNLTTLLGKTSQKYVKSAGFGLSAAWEPDFWGKVSRTVEAADAGLEGSLAAYDAALVTLVADVASSYVSIRTLEARRQTLVKAIADQHEGLAIAESRFRNGETSDLDVSQAQTQLAENEAQLPQFDNSLRQAENGLAVLLAVTPDAVPALLGPAAAIPTAPAEVAVGIPADLLRRRPDVREAELEAAAQSAQIGAAKADLYPTFSVTGFLGVASSSIFGGGITTLFQASNLTANVSPGLQFPIFNYGQLTNRVRAQDAVFQQAVLKYQNTVLSAQKEVEDGLSAWLYGQDSTKSLTLALASAKQTCKLALDRYKQGAADYTTVLTAEESALRIEDSLDSATGGVPQALIAVYRALGGGWEIRQGNDVLPDTVKTDMAKRTNWGGLLDDLPRDPAQTSKPLVRTPDW